MRKILILAALATVIFACKTETKKTGWDENKVFTVTEVLAKPDTFVNKLMKVKGTINHVCKHGGKKAFLMGETEEQTLRCDAGKELAQFDASKIGNDAVVTGVFKEQKVDEAFLSNWEQEVRDELAKAGKETKTAEKHEEKASYEKIGRHEDENDETLVEINKIRQEIKTNGKGYISWYSFEAKSYAIEK
jgi:hypothetical protein